MNRYIHQKRALVYKDPKKIPFSLLRVKGYFRNVLDVKMVLTFTNNPLVANCALYEQRKCYPIFMKKWMDIARWPRYICYI